MSEMLIYQNENGDIKVDVRFEEKSIWLSQSQLCELFGKSKATISEHISHIFEEGELEHISTVRKFRTVQIDGEREVAREKRGQAEFNMSNDGDGYRVKHGMTER